MYCGKWCDLAVSTLPKLTVTVKFYQDQKVTHFLHCLVCSACSHLSFFIYSSGKARSSMCGVNILVAIIYFLIIYQLEMFSYDSNVMKYQLLVLIHPLVKLNAKYMHPGLPFQGAVVM